MWIINKRDNSGVHNGNYHGNFVPQIPHQLLLRYTKKGDWVLDPFMGSGTTLIEAQRLRRNSVGIELQESVAEEAKARINKEHLNGINSIVEVGDSRTFSYTNILKKANIEKFQFAIYHPPYGSIIKFSDSKDDLSNSRSLNDFLKKFGQVVDNSSNYLEKNRYCALVIGDMYKNGQVIPLGFECMNIFLKRGFQLKAILVKNFGDTKAKHNKQGI